MLKDIRRLRQLPGKSFLLFGPRGVGKSTLLKQNFPDALTIDLLRSKNYLELSRDPGKIRDLVAHCKHGEWVVIDEIQRVPALLSEVHALYEEKRLHFALSGSSARKLRRGGADLLAGRALQTYLFPFVYPEFKQITSIEDATEWGSLPAVVTEPSTRVELLETYVETYMRQELLEEGLIRKMDPFSRFLQIAGLINGQILNYENISRDAQVGRTTVQSYFEILEDTMLGFKLPAYRAGAKVKESQHPKFYFFDPGVARAAAGLARETIDNSYRGVGFETLMINQVRAYNHYASKNRGLFFYNVSGSIEIDLIIETGKKTLSKPGELVLIEFKSSNKWKSEWSKPISVFSEKTKSKINRKIGVYLGNQKLSSNGVEVFPAENFLDDLFAGSIF